ncbi:MAG: 3-dehydroquinate synthase, partial [Oscillospiraceae bacterium]|nr:3-dehydroquinate synthase [Oscillospiraceae bacterium]
VAADEFESGRRMLLNFGHTLGHAVEKLSDYSGYSHGQAVAIGMVQIARLAENSGFTQPGTADLIEKLCLKFGLPIASPYKMQELLGTVALDKKSDSKGINFVLLKKPGEAFVKNFSFKQTEYFFLIAE